MQVAKRIYKHKKYILAPMFVVLEHIFIILCESGWLSCIALGYGLDDGGF